MQANEVGQYEEGRETVVATLARAEDEPSFAEAEMSREVTAVEAQANSITIATQEDYEEAAAFGRLVKQKAAQITEWFAPMKKAAHEAHQKVCQREKAMLAPLVEAEKIVKKTMGAYIMEQERRRKEEEERLQRLAQEEAEKKLKEALELEANGRAAEAESALFEADIMDSAGRNVVVEAQKPKAEGASSSIDWEITSVDQQSVPVDFCGMCIRPVDEKAVLKLIRASKGQIKIPGVSYKAVVKLSFRK